MKTLALWVIGAVLVLVAPLALATTSVTFDGYWWSNHNKLEKITLIEGEIDGIGTVCMAASPYMARSEAELAVLHVHSFTEEPRWRPHTAAQFRRKYLSAKKFWQQVCGYGQRFEIYYNEITNYYLEHPHHQSVTVADVMMCLDDSDRARGNMERCQSALH